MSSESDRLKATALIVGCSFFFSSIAIFTVIATERGMSLSALMTGRYLIALLLLGLFVVRRDALKIGAKRALTITVFFGGAQALVAWLSLTSLQSISAGMMAFLFYTFPAIVAVIAALTKTERLTAVRVFALALSLAGILVMVGTPWSMKADLYGVLLALASGIVYAVYVVFVSKIQKDISPAVTTTWICVGAGSFFLIGGVLSSDMHFSTHPAAIGAMLSLAVFSTALAFLGFLRGLAILGTVRTSIVSTLEPFWTSLLGALVLAQPLTGRTLLGGALIAAAVVMLQLFSRDSR